MSIFDGYCFVIGCVHHCGYTICVGGFHNAYGSVLPHPSRSPVHVGRYNKQRASGFHHEKKLYFLLSLSSLSRTWLAQMYRQKAPKVYIYIQRRAWFTFLGASSLLCPAESRRLTEDVERTTQLYPVSFFLLLSFISVVLYLLLFSTFSEPVTLLCNIYFIYITFKDSVN